MLSTGIRMARADKNTDSSNEGRPGANTSSIVNLACRRPRKLGRPGMVERTRRSATSSSKPQRSDIRRKQAVELLEEQEEAGRPQRGEQQDADDRRPPSADRLK